jgi:hypothetical protein
MARVERVNLFEREVRERLSASAVELLFRHAQVLSEGECARATSIDPRIRTVARFFGSTMITADIAALSGSVREPCDAAAAAKVSTLVATDARVAHRAREIAVAEAERLAGGALKQPSTELRVRVRGTIVHLDVDVEGDLAGAARDR